MRQLGNFPMHTFGQGANYRDYHQIHLCCGPTRQLEHMPGLADGEVLVRVLLTTAGADEVSLVESNEDIAACNAEFERAGSDKCQTWYITTRNTLEADVAAKLG